MRAVIQEVFGGPEVLKVADVPTPSPLPTEVVVRVKAAALNPIDAFIRSGRFPPGQGGSLGEPPFTLGWDVSGVIESVVPGVNRFVPGDEVFGMPLFPRAARCYAEKVAAPSRHFARKPANLDYTQAAALPLVGLTAWQSLVDVAAVKAGDRVLVHAAAGGVGHLAVQIAKARGATVLATASSGKHEFVRGLGADEIIDYRKVQFETAARDVDVVLETVGGDYGERSIQALRPGGLLVTIVDRLNTELAAKTRAMGRRFAGVTVEPDYHGLEELARLFEHGKLRVHVERTFPLEQAADAHRFMERDAKGKVVLTL
jgi:NADPH:quinone reductase-like Zn-dependent oxidoreductase